AVVAAPDAVDDALGPGVRDELLPAAAIAGEPVELAVSGAECGGQVWAPPGCAGQHIDSSGAIGNRGDVGAFTGPDLDQELVTGDPQRIRHPRLSPRPGCRGGR